MTLYTIPVILPTSITPFNFEVEAESEEEAKALILKMLMKSDLKRPPIDPNEKEQ